MTSQVEYGADLIRAVWNSIESDTQLDDGLTADLTRIAELHRLLQTVKRTPEKLQTANCSDVDKQVITDLLDSRTKPSNNDWRINVIVSNDCVRKSLQPKVQLTVGTQPVEVTSEQLSSLRYEVARMLHRMQHYI